MRLGTVSELRPEMVGIRQDRRHERWQDAKAKPLYSWSDVRDMIENLAPDSNDKRWERTPKGPKGCAWPSIIDDSWAVARRTNVHVLTNNRIPRHRGVMYGVHR